jgi:hypothetical protein
MAPPINVRRWEASNNDPLSEDVVRFPSEKYSNPSASDVVPVLPEVAYARRGRTRWSNDG